MSDPPIIITNDRSITIKFDTSTFVQSGGSKFYNGWKRIRRVEIDGEGIRFNQDVPSKGRMVIRLHYDSTAHEPPIVITSGSITIEFDTKTFAPSGGSKFSHPRKRIGRVEIEDDAGMRYNQDVPSKGWMVVKIHYSSE